MARNDRRTCRDELATIEMVPLSEVGEGRGSMAMPPVPARERCDAATSYYES
jgi:hypothetical protein